MISPAKFEWRKGRLFVEIQATIKIPIELEPFLKTAGEALHLTKREQQTLNELLKGIGNKEIASAMGISERTVKFFVSKLIEKCKVTTRGEVAAIFSGGAK